MGLLDLFRPKPSVPLTETAEPKPSVTRHGYEYGVPVQGVESDTAARSAGAMRGQVMEQLYQVYLACAPAAACVDTTARMVTAGGLELVPDDSSVSAEDRPLEIQQLDALMRSTNQQEDLIQLCRSTITDLLTFGDGFIEMGYVATVPAALWTMDGTTMAVKCDVHGNVTGYFQYIDGQREAPFTLSEVIHISLDSPRGGVYGVSPTQKLLVPITAWLFTAAVLKEYMRQGAPPRIAVDLGQGTEDTDVERFRQQYSGRNLGPRNQGKPIITRVHRPGMGGEPPIKELSTGHVADLLATLNNLRDQIITGFGMTPAMIGIIESGNLGGGTGESQARTFHYGTVVPLQALLLEKLNYRLLTAQGIKGWKFQFGEVEYRDSKTVEEIRDLRLRNGASTLNQYLAEIGKDPISAEDGGDIHILIDRTNLLVWSDVTAFSKATIAAGSVPAPVPAPIGSAPPEPAEKPDDDTTPTDDAKPADKPAEPKESSARRDARVLDEAWGKAYSAQRRRVLKELPQPELTGATQ